MKKVIVAILMAAMICSLTACGGNNKTGDTSSNTSASAEQADASVSAEEEAKNEPQYEAGVWTDNVYTNTSLGMTLLFRKMADRHRGRNECSTGQRTGSYR